MVKGTGKKLWQLADPIEDNPHYCWDDYRFNWECTVVGSLLVEESENFEIMPWPRRVFLRNYPTINLDGLELKPLLDQYLARLKEKGQTELETQTRRAVDLFINYFQNLDEQGPHDTIGFATLPNSTGAMRFGDIWGNVNGFYKAISSWEDQVDAQRIRSALSYLYENAASERSFIPASYSTELQVVFNALADMSWPGETQWLKGITGIGVAIADSLMYQRAEPYTSDADMSSFYGLAMPLVKNGVALSVAQMERFTEPGYLDSQRVLVLTYEGQKPPSPRLDWVKNGNALVLFGEGDEYNQVSEWWNQGGNTYQRPQDHLNVQAGLGANPAAGLYPVGKGYILIAAESPNTLAHETGGHAVVLAKVAEAYQKLGLSWQPASTLILRKGPYVAAAGMDEGADEADYRLPGQWINLFDSKLAILQDPLIAPNTRWLLYDVSRVTGQAWVIAAAGRVQAEMAGDHSLTFTVDGVANTTCSLRARVPTRPVTIFAGQQPAQFEWHASSQTVLVTFANVISGTSVEITW
jgi:hypothetical protein